MNIFTYKYYYIIILLSLFITLTSCVAFKLPPPMNETEGNKSSDNIFLLTCGVLEYKLPIYSDIFAKLLESTHLFYSVERVGSMNGCCDLYIEIINHAYDDDLSGAAIILTGFELFPYVDEHFDEGCTIAIYDSKGHIINTCLDLTLHEKAIMWLCAPLIALSPEWSLRMPVNTNRYADNVKIKLAKVIHSHPLGNCKCVQ